MKGMRITLTILVSLVLVGLAGAAYPPGWKGPKTITHQYAPGGQTDAFHTQFPSIATSGDAVFMVYYVYVADQAGNLYNWYFKKSTNNGLTWSDSLLLWQNHVTPECSDFMRYNAVTVNEWGIHILMAGESGYPNNFEGIFYTRSTDGGVTFTEPVDIAEYLPPPADYQERDPALVTTSTGMVMAWRSVNAPNYRLWTRRWNGLDWDPPVCAVGPSNSNQIRHPCLVVKPNQPLPWVYLFYDYEGPNVSGLYYKYSTNAGISWSAVESPIIDEGVGLYTWNVSPAAAYCPTNGKVWVFWMGNSGNPPYNPPEYFRIRCSWVGAAPGSFTCVSPLNQTFHQSSPRVVVGPGDSVTVVWEDNRELPPHYQIFARSGIWKNKPSGHWEWEPQFGRISEDVNSNPPHYDDLNPDIAFLSCSGSRVAVWDGIYHWNDDLSRQIWYHKKSSDATPPGAPGGLQVTPMMGCLYLYWTPLPVDAYGYNVYRAEGVMPPFIFVKLNPQPMTEPYYNDCSANLGLCYTYQVTALDCAENEGQPSSPAYYFGCSMGDQLVSVDVGNPTPPSNTVRRAGYYTWGSTPDSTVDYDPDSLVYRFSGLAPDSFYLLGVGYFENGTSRRREQSLRIDGVEVHGRSLLPGWPAQMVYLVPKRSYRDGRIDVSFVREQGPNAVVAQLWLYQAHFPGGGPQSGGYAEGAARFHLYPAQPNPTTGETEVCYSLDRTGDTKLSVYNVSGQIVRTIAGMGTPGLHRIVWDGRDDRGHPAGSAVYLLKLQSGSRSLTGRVTLIR
jgi:hypothetical protein